MAENSVSVPPLDVPNNVPFRNETNAGIQLLGQNDVLNTVRLPQIALEFVTKEFRTVASTLNLDPSDINSIIAHTSDLASRAFALYNLVESIKDTIINSVTAPFQGLREN